MGFKEPSSSEKGTREASGLELSRTGPLELSEHVWRGRLRHHTDVTEKGEPEEDKEMETDNNVLDMKHGRPDAQQETRKDGSK